MPASPAPSPVEPTKDSADPALRAHCRRVAAWAVELASSLRLPADDCAIVEQAALLHHTPVHLLRGATLSRLLKDLRIEVSGGFGVTSEGMRLEVRRVLDRFHLGVAAAGGSREQRLAEILELANLYDEHFEFAPYQQASMSAVLEAAVPSGAFDSSDPAMSTVLGRLRKARREDVLRLIPKLPVYPSVAIRACQLLTSERASLNEFEQLAMSDQVLAGNVIKAANTAFFSPRHPITTLRNAVQYMGWDAARELICVLALKPLFASSKLKQLWTHALESAKTAQTIAQISGHVNPSEAFLCGLVHDVGRLAIALLPANVQAIFERMVERGCPPSLVELTLYGFDHAEASAEILTTWKFAPPLVEGIRFHHQPEMTDSALASVLYLTEFWTCSEEDLPSLARLHGALQRLNLTLAQLQSADFKRSSPIDLAA